jgi:hypothetical protein
MKALIAILFLAFSLSTQAAPRHLLSITHTGGVGSYLGLRDIDVMNTYGRIYATVGDNTYDIYIKNLTTPRVITAKITQRVRVFTGNGPVDFDWDYPPAPEFVFSGCGVVVNTLGTCTLSVIYSPTVASGPTTGYVLQVFFNNSTVPYRVYTLDTWVE